MGLTIHFGFEFRGSKEQAKALLKMMEGFTFGIGKRVGEDLDPEFYEIDFGKSGDKLLKSKEVGDRKAWACIQYRKLGIEIVGDRAIDGAKSEDGFIVNLRMPIGCESMNIGLFRHKSKDRDLWEGSAFCKSQYAEDFIKAHLLVIMVLDYCKKIGILKKVSDDGHYWETRDLKMLGDNITESTQTLLKLSKLFEQAGYVPVIDAIRKQANIVEVR